MIGIKLLQVAWKIVHNLVNTFFEFFIRGELKSDEFFLARAGSDSSRLMCFTSLCSSSDILSFSF